MEEEGIVWARIPNEPLHGLELKEGQPNAFQIYSGE